jgi:hypothetical protein
MSARAIGVCVAAALCFALTPVPGRAAATVRGKVLSGGATPASGATGSGRVLVGTVGQPAVGASAELNGHLCLGFWCFGGVRIVSVEEDPRDPGLPTALAFGVPVPNPARGAVALRLALPRAADVRVSVLDVEGRVVGSMHAGRLDPGRYRLEWDGTDGEGRVSPSGVYFARLTIDGSAMGQRRIVRLR